MEPAVYSKFREALKMVSFRRYGLAAEMLEELVESSGDGECRYWLAYAYRRMRRYDEALAALRKLPRAREELETIATEQRAYNLFRKAMELQGLGQYREIRQLLRAARDNVPDDPELSEWIDEELEFYSSRLFDV